VSTYTERASRKPVKAGNVTVRIHYKDSAGEPQTIFAPLSELVTKLAEITADRGTLVSISQARDVS
jgi:hypothetical protein